MSLSLPLEHAVAAAPLGERTRRQHHYFRRCDGSRCSRSWHRAVRRRRARTCRCSRTTACGRCRRWQHFSTRSLRNADAKIRSEDAARVRTGREFTPTSAATRKEKPLQHGSAAEEPRPPDPTLGERCPCLSSGWQQRLAAEGFRLERGGTASFPPAQDRSSAREQMARRWLRRRAARESTLLRAGSSAATRRRHRL